MAADIINDVRAATAAMLGLPTPPPVGSKASGDVQPDAAGADGVDATSSVGASSSASSSSSAATSGDDGAPIEITHDDSDVDELPAGRRRLTRASLGKAAATASSSAPSSASASSAAASGKAAPSKPHGGKAGAGSSLLPVAGFPEGGLTAAFDVDAGYVLPLVDPSAPAPGSAAKGAGRKSGKAAGAGAVASPARSGAGAGAGKAAAGAAASALCGLQLRDVSAVLKVVPDRVYSVAFHPSAEKVLCICGSKAGFVGVWEPDMGRLLQAPSASSSSSAGASVSLSARSKSSTGAGAGPAAKRPRHGGLEGEAEEADEADKDASAAAADAEEGDAGEAEADGVGATSPSAAGGLRFGGSAASGFKRKGPVSADPSAFDEADLPADKVAVFAPHSAPVNYLQVPRGAPHLLVTSSYDGSFRALDFNSGVSWEWLADIKGRGVSAMDVMEVATLGAASHMGGAAAAAAGAAGSASAGPGISCAVLVGTYDGQIGLVDPRARSLAAAFQAHDRKVTATSACGGSAYFLSSSSDAKVHLWDVRKMGHAHKAPCSGSDSAKRSAAAAAAASSSSAASSRVSHVPLTSVASSQAVSSAFFSPLGTRVIATCNDNKLRLWDTVWSGSGDPSLKPTVALWHNNHTGRWLSQLRAVFDPSDDGVFVCGNMDRSVEVFDAASGDRLASLTSEWLTAVPTLNAIHPSLERRLILSGTASGRLHLWS